MARNTNRGPFNHPTASEMAPTAWYRFCAEENARVDLERRGRNC